MIIMKSNNEMTMIMSENERRNNEENEENIMKKIWNDNNVQW